MFLENLSQMQKSVPPLTVNKQTPCTWRTGTHHTRPARSPAPPWTSGWPSRARCPLWGAGSPSTSTRTSWWWARWCQRRVWWSLRRLGATWGSHSGYLWWTSRSSSVYLNFGPLNLPTNFKNKQTWKLNNNCHNPNDNTTQPQHGTWVGHKMNVQTTHPTPPTHPPQKLNCSLQEPQINIHWPQLNIMWPVTTRKATTAKFTTTTTISKKFTAFKSLRITFIDHN